MRYSATIEIIKDGKVSYAKELEHYYNTKRSTTTATDYESKLKISIKAKDITALSASCASVLKELKLIEEISSISASSAKKPKSKNI